MDDTKGIVSGFALEWIEILTAVSVGIVMMSPASRWSGLKCSPEALKNMLTKSPASRWSGLKCVAVALCGISQFVSGFALEWIEMGR